jgi:hypothetical protein
MISTERIELRKTRDFGATINVIFEFLRQNWRPLGKSLLFIMGPVVILGTLAAGAYVRTLLGVIDRDPESINAMMSAYGTMLPMIALSGFSFLIALVFMFGVVSGYVRLYNDRYPEPIEVDDVWREVRHSFWRIVATLLVATVVAALPMVILLAPAALLREWWLVPVGIMLATIPMLYLYNCMTIVVPMRLEEEIGVFEAIGRSIRLLKGRWWFTFWLFVVIQIILTFASMIFQIPLQAIVMMRSLGGGMESPGMLIYIAVAFNVIGSYLLYSVTVLTCSVQYYNLVEQKDGVGMVDRINEIGVQLDEPTTTL